MFLYKCVCVCVCLCGVLELHWVHNPISRRKDKVYSYEALMMDILREYYLYDNHIVYLYPNLQ